MVRVLASSMMGERRGLQRRKLSARKTIYFQSKAVAALATARHREAVSSGSPMSLTDSPLLAVAKGEAEPLSSAGRRQTADRLERSGSPTRLSGAGSGRTPTRNAARVLETVRYSQSVASAQRKGL
jgi:hypothetical protein